MGVLWFCMLLMVDPAARRADVSGGVAAELRGGAAPVVPFQPSRATMMLVVRPNIDLRIRDRRRTEFTIGGAPRMLLRVPNQLGVNRPVFLGTAYLSLTTSISRRWTYGFNVDATAGEVDYTSAGFVLGPQQTAVPSREITKYASVSGRTTFRARITRQHTVLFGGDVGYATPFGSSTNPLVVNGVSLQPLPRYVSGGLTVGHEYQATTFDRITTTVRPSIVQFQPGPLFVNVEGNVGWNRRIRRALGSVLEAGVLTAQIADRGGRTDAESRTMPLGRAGLFGMLYGDADVELDAAISGRYFGFFDPIRARLIPRVGLDLELAAHLEPGWTVGGRLTAFTTATKDPTPDPNAMNTMNTNAGFSLDETFLTLQIPATYRLDQNHTFEVGLLGTARGPHLSADRFRLRNFEGWVYVAYRFAIGTARGRREVQERTGSISTGATRSGVGNVRDGQPPTPRGRRPQQDDDDVLDVRELERRARPDDGVAAEDDGVDASTMPPSTTTPTKVEPEQPTDPTSEPPPEPEPTDPPTDEPTEPTPPPAPDVNDGAAADTSG